ncbi:MAG: hypothetical protein ISR45_11755 [Rhodospirillales bacterium]|nr:hypothetical protein [Rhodospirillales bacterium]
MHNVTTSTKALEQGEQLPESWHQFSQHAFDALPLPNKHLTSAQIIQFRDYAWDTYFGAPGYLDMMGRKFGPQIVEHIGRMRNIPLARKIAPEGNLA